MGTIFHEIYDLSEKQREGNVYQAVRFRKRQR